MKNKYDMQPNSSKIHNRGFGSMTTEKVRALASQGGRTSTENTCKRGFGSMPIDRVKALARKGGEASQASNKHIQV